MNREAIFKIIVILFSICLFFAGAFLLFWFDVVKFSWSEEFKKEYNYERSKEKKKRILILGDSQLEKHIARNSLFMHLKEFCEDHGIGYANAAHFGFGPIEYHSSLEKIAFDYEPDLIILFYNAYNDLTDVYVRLGKEPTIISHSPFINEGKKATMDSVILENSILVPSAPATVANGSDSSIDSVVATQKIDPEKPNDPYKLSLEDFDWKKFEEHGIHPDIIKYAKKRILNPYAYGPDLVNPHVLTMAMWLPDFLHYNLTTDFLESRYGWYHTLRYFEAMLRINDALKSKFVVVCIPSTAQVDTSHHDFFRKLTFNFSPSILRENSPQMILDSLSKASNIHYINVLPHFKAHPNSGELYYENDDHLNDKGQTLVFEILKKEILNPYVRNTIQDYEGEREKNYFENYRSWKKEHEVRQLKRKIGIE